VQLQLQLHLQFWILDSGWWVLGSRFPLRLLETKKAGYCANSAPCGCVAFSVQQPPVGCKMQPGKNNSQPASHPGNMSQTRGLELKKVESLDDGDDDGGSYDSTPNSPHSLGARCTCVCTVSWPKSAFGGPASWPATPSPSQAVANYALRLNCLEPLETG